VREGHWKGWALKLVYIKLPMYLFFYVALGTYDFDAGKSITGPLKGGRGPENLDFMWPKWYLLPHCHFRAQKSLLRMTTIFFLRNRIPGDVRVYSEL
jgi:hypothetical protein